ncbi:MAG: 3-oxoacyl-[acyl-carrier-protein] synthase III C-terminal domain-containing protein [Bdellovibrionia bacterium]
MKPVFVSHLAYALGEQVFSVEQSAEAKRIFSGPQQFRDAGFSEHRVCAPGTSPYALTHQAVSQLGESIQGTGAIIYATCLPLNGNIGDPSKFTETRDVKHLMDFPASHLQADFGLDNASVIGLNQQACTSMLGSMRLARALIQTEPDLKKVLCVTSDRFPEGATYEQAYNVISDGAAACLVSDEPHGYRIMCTHAITNGALAQASDDETVGSYFNYTYRLMEETLAKASLKMSDINWVIPQNTNVNAWMILSRLLGIDFERVYFGSISEVAHIISSDNVVNLKKLESTGNLRSGDRLLLFMAGFGLNWQAVILQKV